MSRTRRRIDGKAHQAVFAWVLRRLADAGPLRGKTIGIDAATLEVNAALRSIVRPDTGEGYETLPRGPAATSGIPSPPRVELARVDRKRPKKGSNDDWTHPQDPDEHAVDREAGAVAGDTTTMVETLVTAAERVEAVLPAGAGVAEVVWDKGYHSNETLVALAELGLRSYVAKSVRGRRRWRGKPAARAAVYANRGIRGCHGLRLLYQRGDCLERPSAHLYETGGMRRVLLRGHANIFKRPIPPRPASRALSQPQPHVVGRRRGIPASGVRVPRLSSGRRRPSGDPQPPPAPLLEVVLPPHHPQDRAHPREAVEHHREEGQGPEPGQGCRGVDPVEELPHFGRREDRRRALGDDVGGHVERETRPRVLPDARRPAANTPPTSPPGARP